MNRPKEKIYAFIDSQNLYQGIKHRGWDLDYRKFMSLLRTKYEVDKVFMFIGYISSNSKLYEELEKIGYQLVFKEVLEVSRFGKTKYKGNVDAELVLHTMINYPKFHKAIIVSGDGDFYCLVQYLEAKNKLFKIMVPTFRFSSLLRKYDEYIVKLEGLKKKLQN